MPKGKTNLLTALINLSSKSNPTSRYIIKSRTIDYTYDNLNRLTLADYDSGETFTYGYDPLGNRLTQTINSKLTSYAYDEANRLTNVNGMAYEWDDNGNLLSDGTRVFTYNAANRLTQVVSGSLDSHFEYNGPGDRTRQWVNGVETYYLLDPVGLTQVLAESTNGQSQFYVAGLAHYDRTEWAYQLPDPLGSVRQLINGQGQVKLTQSYDPFGNLIEQIGQIPSGFGYTGQQHDPSAGLVYLRARYYDPATGRFISKDPFPGLSTLPQTQNPYPYVVNNPVNHTDPSGELFDAAFDVALALTDLGLLGYHTYQWWNECDPSARQALEQQMALDATSFMINAAFFFIPGATGGGQFYRGGRLAFAHGGMVSAGSLAQAATETAKVTRRMAQGATKVGQAYLMAKGTDGSSQGSYKIYIVRNVKTNEVIYLTVRSKKWKNDDERLVG